LTTPNGSDSAEIEVADIAPALFHTPEPGPVLYATGLVDWHGPLTVKLGAAEVEGRVYPGPVAGVQRIEFTVPSSISVGPLDASVRAGQFESNTVRVMLR
jgi:hypothetical protein